MDNRTLETMRQIITEAGLMVQDLTIQATSKNVTTVNEILVRLQIVQNTITHELNERSEATAPDPEAHEDPEEPNVVKFDKNGDAAQH